MGAHYGRETLMADGGKAPTFEENTSEALAKPYVLVHPLTAEQVANLDEMLVILFDVDREQEIVIDDLEETVTAIEENILIVSGSLTQAQLEVMNTTPVTVIAAQGAGTVIHPISMLIELVVTDAYTSSPTFNLRHPSATQDLMNAISPIWTNVTTVIGQSVHGNNNVAVSTFDRRNKAVQMRLSANPAGVGVATAQYRILYTVITGF